MGVIRPEGQNLALFGKSDIGKVRQENQDSFKIRCAEGEDLLLKRGHLVVLADGMGGLAHGGKASKIAVETIEKAYFEKEGECSAALLKSVEDANLKIFKEAQKLPGSQPMGSTLTAMAILEGNAIVAQVGDSRAYRISNSQFQQLTRDHTLVQELADRGEIQPDSVPYLLNRNVLTRGLGLQDDIEVDLFDVSDLKPGESFLLCSDGLYDVVADSEIESQVLAHGDAVEDLVTYLIELARSRGAPDNVTIVVIRVGVEEEDAGAADAADRAQSGDGLDIGTDDASSSGFSKPISYFVVFALGVLLTLLFEDKSSQGEGRFVEEELRDTAEKMLAHPRSRQYLEENAGAELGEEIDRFLEWIAEADEHESSSSD